MKPESLEALLIDRALGELPEPTCELLEAHLAADPGAAAQAQVWSETAALARRAVAPARADALVLPPPAFAGRVRKPWWPAGADEAWRLAACLMVGLGLGWLAKGGSGGGGPTPAVVATVQAGPETLPRATGPRAAAKFWSVARVAAESGAARRVAVARPGELSHWLGSKPTSLEDK